MAEEEQGRWPYPPAGRTPIVVDKEGIYRGDLYPPPPTQPNVLNW